MAQATKQYNGMTTWDTLGIHVRQRSMGWCERGIDQNVDRLNLNTNPNPTHLKCLAVTRHEGRRFNWHDFRSNNGKYYVLISTEYSIKPHWLEVFTVQRDGYRMAFVRWRRGVVVPVPVKALVKK